MPQNSTFDNFIITFSRWVGRGAGDPLVTPISFLKSRFVLCMFVLIEYCIYIYENVAARDQMLIWTPVKAISLCNLVHRAMQFIAKMLYYYIDASIPSCNAKKALPVSPKAHITGESPVTPWMNKAKKRWPPLACPSRLLVINTAYHRDDM